MGAGEAPFGCELQCGQRGGQCYRVADTHHGGVLEWKVPHTGGRPELVMKPCERKEARGTSPCLSSESSAAVFGDSASAVTL